MGDFNSLEKTCAFYISEVHLSAMIVPYISKKINNNNTIETFLEFNLEKNIEIILSKLLLDGKNKNKIKNINWKITNLEDNLIENKINKLINNSNNEISILINGNYEYIKKINDMLIKKLNKNSEKIINKKIRLINCYSTEIVDEYLEEIIEDHETMLNTAGLKRIEEIFEKNSKKVSV